MLVIIGGVYFQFQRSGLSFLPGDNMCLPPQIFFALPSEMKNYTDQYS